MKPKTETREQLRVVFKKFVKHQGFYQSFEAFYGEVKKKREMRAKNKTLIERKSILQKVIEPYLTWIKNHGGEAYILTETGLTYLRQTDFSNGMRLLHCEGWRKYSRRKSWFAELSYLCGRDENGQIWAVRVPGNRLMVWQALDWMTPAPARKKGTIRQGDVYFVPSAKDDFSRLPHRHVWTQETRTCSHPEHNPVHIPFPAKVYLQKAYGLGRGARFRNSD